ncbi:transcriptional regulator [Streptomyces sp. NPDC021224]|uniref:transcriptional regulator n=1 Tax=unclassified Streptomyces TaxID=2593676 RepID=UPI00378FC753
MSATCSGSPACPDKSRQRRLVARLAAAVPGAATIQVSLTDPKAVWPHPHAVARGATGQPVELTRTGSTVMARWILRAWPDVDWSRPHTLDLGSARICADPSTHRGEGR